MDGDNKIFLSAKYLIAYEGTEKYGNTSEAFHEVNEQINVGQIHT